MTFSRPRPWRAEALLAALVFLASAVWGGSYYTRFVRNGGHPFFYQSYYEPAVMTACGRGFLVSKRQPPALRAFLLEQTDRFSCDSLPADLRVGSEGLYQRPWRYLMTIVALTWMALGISWSGLGPMFGLLFGATTLLAYAVCRQLVGRVAALACAAALCVSSLQLANLPNLRDYAKAPFTLALLLILIAIVRRPLSRRVLLLSSLGYGLIMGIGYGFRTDLLVDIPPFLITVALFLPGRILGQITLKAAAVLLFAAGFVIAGWPIITTVAASGGCQWHVFLLGLTDPFNQTLGVDGGSYGWGHLYKDEYTWAAVSGYANRFRPDLGYIEYCSHQYDIASWEYLRRILLTFPADIVTRAYGSALQVLNLPFHRVEHLVRVGPLLAAAFVLAASRHSVRLMLFAVFVILYFAGHPAIQFLPRHYFPFEVIAWAILAFLVERAGRAAIAFARDPDRSIPAPDRADLVRAAKCALLVAGLLVLPLGLLRWYQQSIATRLLASYASTTHGSTPLDLVAPGRFRVPVDSAAPHLSAVEALAALGQVKTRFVALELDASACRPATTVTYRYDPAYPDLDFSWTATVEQAATGQGVTRLFEPVYAQFQGVDVSDPSSACLRQASMLRDLEQWPLLLPAHLRPNWASQPQYQRIAYAK